MKTSQWLFLYEHIQCCLMQPPTLLPLHWCLHPLDLRGCRILPLP